MKMTDAGAMNGTRFARRPYFKHYALAVAGARTELPRPAAASRTGLGERGGATFGTAGYAVGVCVPKSGGVAAKWICRFRWRSSAAAIVALAFFSFGFLPIALGAVAEFSRPSKAAEPSGILDTIYINNHNSCPGTGSATNQYCSIQNALDVAGPGSDIRIQNTGTEYNECVTMNTSGTAANPIVIESDNAASQAVLTCHTQSANAAFYGNGVSYVTIQNLTWDGAFNGVPGWGLAFNHSGGIVSSVQVLNNTFNGWGASNTTANGDGYFTNGSIIINEAFGGPNTVDGAVVSGNHINGGRAWGIWIDDATNTVVSNNLIENLVCGSQGGYGTEPIVEGIEDVDATTGTRTNNDFKNNVIRNFTGVCNLGSFYTQGVGSYGFHCDGGGTNGTVENNTIYNISTTNATGPNSIPVGIEFEFECTGWTAKNNIVNNMGTSNGIGIQIGTNDLTGAGPDLVYNNTIANNVLMGIRTGVSSVIIKNNTLYNNGFQIQYNSGNMTSDYNSFWDTSGGNRVGAYNGYTAIDLATWKADTGGDAHSINADPNMISPDTTQTANFKLNAGSNVIGAGTAVSGMTLDCLGVTRPNPPSMGCYEYPN